MTVSDELHDRRRGRGGALAVVALVTGTVLALHVVDPMLVPLAAGIAALAVVAVRWPLIGLVCLTAMLVSNLSSNLITGFGLPSVAKLALPGLVGLLGLRYLLRREVPYIPWAFAALSAGFLAVKLLGAANALHWQVALEVTDGFARDVAVVLVALAFLRHRGAFEAVTTTILVVLAVLCALGAAQYVGGEMLREFGGFSQIHDGNGRFSGPIGDPNFFCAVLAFGTPLAIFRACDARGAGVLVWGAVLALILFGAAATQSRGGMLALLVGVAVLLPSMSRRQVGATALIGALAVALAAATLGEAQLDRLRGIADLAMDDGTIDRATEGRLASWQVAIELFRAHPVFGVGPGNFNLYYQDIALELGLIFRGEGRSAHSLYLEQLAEMGVVGLGWFLLLLLVAALSVIRATRIARRSGDPRRARHYAAFGAGLTAYLAAMVFLHDSYPRFLLLMIGLAVELARHAAREAGGTGADRAGQAPPV